MRRGLLRVVRTTDALVLTDGLSGGVASMVGRAVHESGDMQTVTVLGVASWEEVRHRDQLAAKGKGKVCKYGDSKHALSERSLAERTVRRPAQEVACACRGLSRLPRRQP